MNSDEVSPILWLSDQTWQSIKCLAVLDNYFSKLPADMEENSNRFYEWYQSYNPETEKLPGMYCILSYYLPIYLILSQEIGEI